MNSLAFWNNWPPYQQKLFWFFAGLTIIGFSFLWYSDFKTPEPVISTLRSPEISAAPFDHHTFQIGTFKLNVPADALIILERSIGAPLNPNFPAAYLFLGILAAALLGFLTIITTLPRFWFFTGLGFFVLILAGLRLETVLLFGMSSYFPVIGIALFFVALSCYYGLLNPGVSFLLRLVSFLLAAAVVGCLIFFFAKSNNPFALVAANAIIPATVLTIIFIFTVAHEIIASLMAVISRGTRQTKSLRHFLVISAVYMINLGLIYANRKYLIHWEFLKINLMLLITLSGILGLWGFRHREPQYEGIFKANPIGVFFYLLLAAIGFTTLGYFLATANDPIVKLSEDAILYSHLGYGIIFLIYVINNFGSMLYKNLQAYKVLYRPDNMPYFTFRFAGLICTFVFFAYSNWKGSLNQVYSGYFNAQGDVFLKHDTLNLADSYYQHSIKYSLRNYHANYALAQLYAAQGKTSLEKRQYQLLVDSRPLDVAYLNLAAISRAEHAYRPTMDILRVGLRDFPKNGRIENEIALDYADSGIGDSAFRYVEAALHSSNIKIAAETNRIGFAVKFRPRLSVDSLLKVSDKDIPGVATNAFALACLQDILLPAPPAISDDSTASVYQILTVYNYLLSQKDAVDTAYISNAVAIARKNENPYYRYFLLSSAAFGSYSNNQTGQAFRLLREAAFAGQVDHLFNALGLWALEQNIPARSIQYFDEAIKQEYQPAIYNRAVGLTESGDLIKAEAAWRSLVDSKDIARSTRASQMIGVITIHENEIEKLSDEDKYMFIRYRVPLLETAKFERAVNLITDPEWKTRAVVDRCLQLDEAGEIDLAKAVLDAMSGSSIKNASVFQQALHQKILFLAADRNFTALASELKNKQLSFAGAYAVQKIYFNALLHAHENKKAEAIKEYSWLLNADPFFEDGVVEAVEFLYENSDDKLKIYSLLVSALDLNPNSVKLLKVYAVLSFRLDFPETGESTVEQLKKVMSEREFAAFLKKYPDLFQVLAD